MNEVKTPEDAEHYASLGIIPFHVQDEAYRIFLANRDKKDPLDSAENRARVRWLVKQCRVSLSVPGAAYRELICMAIGHPDNAMSICS